MKKIFAIIMSFQLILTPVALAQSGGYNIPGTEESKTGVDAYKTTGNGSLEGGKQFANSLLMTGSGAFGSCLIFCASNSPINFSHYIFMGGAVVLLAGEIAAAIKQKEAKEESEKQVARMNIANAKPGEEITQEQKDTQLGLLELAKEEEIKNRDALKARMDWMTAAEVVYWLAAAGAATETVMYALSVYTGYTTPQLYNCVGPQTQTAIMAIGAAYGALANSGRGVGKVVTGAASVAGFMVMLNILITSIAPGLNTSLTWPASRIIIFGVFAALAGVVREGYKNKVETAENNIAKIETAIVEWTSAGKEGSETEIDTTAVVAQGDYGGLNAANKTNKLYKSQVKSFKSGKCLSSNAKGLEHSANACRKPLKFDRSVVKFDSKFLNGVANQAFEMSESFAQDDMGGAPLQASALASNAARVKSEALGLIKAANNELVKNGGKGIDFDKEVKAQLASYSKLAEDAATSGGMKPSSGNVATLDAEKDKKPVAVKPFVAPVAAVPARQMPNLSMGSEMPESAPGPAVTVQTIDDFETTEQDFSKQKDVSIFEQLSHRYFLNYSKVFERKKRPDVVIPEEVKKN